LDCRTPDDLQGDQEDQGGLHREIEEINEKSDLPDRRINKKLDLPDLPELLVNNSLSSL
jgi:hypothetical protein